jgi:hypothetical protein
MRQKKKKKTTTNIVDRKLPQEVGD